MDRSALEERVKQLLQKAEGSMKRIALQAQFMAVRKGNQEFPSQRVLELETDTLIKETDSKNK